MILHRMNEDAVEEIYDVQFVSTGIKIVTFIYVIIIEQYRKRKGQRTSALLFLFWLILSVCAAPHILWEVNNFNIDFEDDERLWASYHSISYIIYFTMISIMTVLTAIIDKEPENSTYQKYANPSPELKAGALNLFFFQWFSPTTWKGFKRPLIEDDIYDVNPDYASNEVIPEFDNYFQQSIEKERRKSAKSKEPEKIDPLETNGSVIYALVRAFGGRYLFTIFLRAIADFIQFASPFLLLILMQYVEANGALWKGLLLTFTFFFLSAISALINNYQYLIAFQVGFKARTSLIGAVYRKALKISSAAKKDITIGEIVNLMSVDAHRFYEMMPYLPFVVTMPFVMGLAMYLLWTVLGVSAFAGLAVLIIMFPFSGAIATQLQKYQANQMQYKDDRVKKISEILGGIKVIKFYAWEQSFQEQIRETRESELKHLRGAALMTASTDFLWTLTPFMITLATFATYVFLGNVLTPSTAFVSIVLFNILRLPITLLPMSINFIMMGIVSTRRLNKFMNSKELDPTNVTNYPSEFALQIINGNFSWDGKDKALKGINLSVKKGNLVAVVGQVGSGKSSLISALLGDMEKIEGQVNVDGTIAYVPQVAWIQNATLQDNILFGKPLNEKYYEKVIQACALTADLAMLPGGDKTEIGEKGINLSGGQKARVSLARAVYSNADIYIFDDPLSAVDSHVGKHIFDNIFGEEGLLKDKTRFLVTHAISYLPRVDEIFVLTNGEIREKGSYRLLLAQKGTFAEFLIEYLQEHEEDEDITEIKVQLENEEGQYIMRKSFSKSSDHVLKRQGSKLSNKEDTKPESKINETTEDVDKLIESEEAAVGDVAFSVYIRYFKSVGGGLVLLILFVAMCSETSSVLANLLIVQWAEDERAGTETFWRNFYVGIYGAFGFLLGLSFLTAAISFAFGAIRAARNLHNRLLANILRLPMAFFDTTPLGRIVNRFSRDTDMIDSYIPAMMFSFCNMFFSVAGTIALITYATPWFATVIIPLALIYYFIQKFYIKTSRQIKRIESVTRSPIYSHFGESVGGQSVIRAFKEQDRFKKESEEKVDKNLSILYQTNVADCWLGVRLETIGACIVMFACLFAILARDTIGEAMVGLSISYAIQIAAVLSYFVMIATEVETNIIAVERVEEYAELPQEAPLKTIDVDANWPYEGIIEFKDFQVRYREGLELVLKGISFKCNSQEKIGIVGRTGAGKSSLTLSLFRIIEASGGKIVIDGIDISTIGLHCLRSKLTIIPQDPVLFSGSLRMNIDPFNSYSDDAVWTALEHSHLKTFASQLTDGLNYKVSEGGDNLSVGQRQLICLARALLRKTRVLILDEATAAIDIETDELIQNTIRTEFKDCTILTIAHRLNTIMDSDRIIVLDQGKIVEFDSPNVLLSDKDSIFYSMAKSAGIANGEDTKVIKE
ncbi:hypothetical protein ACKWTF_013819 [Chironomus riparius]